MIIDNSLKEKIDNLFKAESDKNTVSEDFLVNNGIDPNSLIGDTEIQLAKDAMEEEEWLKKLMYDSIMATISNNLDIHASLKEEITEHCERTEQYILLQDYFLLLEKYTDKN
jgi:hypothetical protein